jgi:hypothetical protein
VSNVFSPQVAVAFIKEKFSLPDTSTVEAAIERFRVTKMGKDEKLITAAYFSTSRTKTFGKLFN